MVTLMWISVCGSSLNAVADGNFHLRLIQSSGCIEKSRFDNSYLSDYVSQLPSNGSKIDIVAMMIDPDQDQAVHRELYRYPRLYDY